LAGWMPAGPALAAAAKAATPAPAAAPAPAPATSPDDRPDTPADRPGEDPAAADARIVVTGSVRALRADDAPYAVGLIDATALRDLGPGAGLAQALARIPGVFAADRQNLAQDLQLSVRGFGARAGFGVRGLRLVADGIPASGPDGQGQVAHIDLDAAERVEVLRGPFSVLLGASSAGAVAVFSAPVSRARSELELQAGSFGARQWRAALARPLDGGWGLRAAAGRWEGRGPRPHSRAGRSLASATLGRDTPTQRLVLQASHWEQPAQDPLGLTRAQFDADPGQTTPEARLFDTRKSARQSQGGVAWTWRPRADSGSQGDPGGSDAIGLQEAGASAWAGQRRIWQWLAIPVATQANPRHGGGVVDLDRAYAGAEAGARWAWPALGLQGRLGLGLQDQRDLRRGWDNFSGAGPVLGTIGALRRDERQRATSRDAWLQLEWRPLAAPGLLLSAGVRHSAVDLQAEDRFLANGDDSGTRRLAARSPALGLSWQAAPGWTLHAAAGRGFETPTLGELAYRPDGSGGFNTTLAPQRSRQGELGLRWRGRAPQSGGGPPAVTDGRDAAALDLTLFRADVADEIGVASNAGGRASFRNVGRTRRQGLELAGSVAPAAHWQVQASATWLSARHLDPFLACAGLPCLAASVPVPAGVRVAGTQRLLGWAELAWSGLPRQRLALQWRGQGSTAANDRNSVVAPGAAWQALQWSAGWDLAGGWRLEPALRVDNLADRRAVGSVIVNEANGRVLEPAPPRQWALSLRVVAPR
jgi:iron complex outermembrane receptor protein